MAEKISLWVFWVAMLACAGSALIGIWGGEGVIPMQFIPTFFIVGFASFLIWAPIVAYKFLQK